jgi:hypothetical protein
MNYTRPLFVFTFSAAATERANDACTRAVEAAAAAAEGTRIAEAKVAAIIDNTDGDGDGGGDGVAAAVRGIRDLFAAEINTLKESVARGERSVRSTELYLRDVEDAAVRVIARCFVAVIVFLYSSTILVLHIHTTFPHTFISFYFFCLVIQERGRAKAALQTSRRKQHWRSLFFNVVCTSSNSSSRSSTILSYVQERGRAKAASADKQKKAALATARAEWTLLEESYKTQLDAAKKSVMNAEFGGGDDGDDNNENGVGDGDGERGRLDLRGRVKRAKDAVASVFRDELRAMHDRFATRLATMQVCSLLFLSKSVFFESVLFDVLFCLLSCDA